MANRDLVVVLEHPVRVGAVHLTHAPHPEPVELGRAEGAHARRAVHVDPLGQCEQDLLVPYRRHALEHPVHQGDGTGPAQRGPEYVAVAGGGKVLRVQHLPGLVVGQGRPEEHHHLRHDASRNARRRAPGTLASTLSVQPSIPGTTIRTTGTAASGRVRSTRIASRAPTARSRSSSWVTSVVDGRPWNVRHLGERPARPSFEARHVRRDRPRVLHLPVVARRAVVAAAGDQREAALGRLCQGARQRHPAIGMTAAAHRGREAPRPVGAAVDDRHREHRETDFRRQVERHDADSCRLVRVEQRQAAGITDGVEVDATRRPVRRLAVAPQSERVALHHLAERVAHGLEKMVPSREAGPVREEAAAALWAGRTEVEMHALVGNPGALAAEHVRALDPQDREVGVEPRPGGPRQLLDVHHPGDRPELAVRREAKGQEDVLGMPALQGLHDPRHLGRGQVDALPLGHGKRPAVRPADHHDRDADHVQAGDHGDTRDPDAWKDGEEPAERFGGLDRAVRPVEVELLRCRERRHRHAPPRSRGRTRTARRRAPRPRASAWRRTRMPPPASG